MEDDPKRTIQEASLRIAEVMRQHRAGKPILAEMAARIHERSAEGIAERLVRDAMEED